MGDNSLCYVTTVISLMTISTAMVEIMFLISQMTSRKYILMVM